MAALSGLSVLLVVCGVALTYRSPGIEASFAPADGHPLPYHGPYCAHVHSGARWVASVGRLTVSLARPFLASPGMDPAPVTPCFPWPAEWPFMARKCAI